MLRLDGSREVRGCDAVGAGTSHRIVLQGQRSDWRHVFLTLWTSQYSGSEPVERTRQQRRVVGRPTPQVIRLAPGPGQGGLPQSVVSRAREPGDGHAASGVLRDLSRLSRRETLDRSALQQAPDGREAARGSALSSWTPPCPRVRACLPSATAAEPIKRLRRTSVPSRQRELRGRGHTA